MTRHIVTNSILSIFLMGLLLGCGTDPAIDGVDGLVSLVKVNPETAGTNCGAGGYKIETGLDKNSDSVLDASEVQNSVYICNGLNGINGTNGTNGTSGTNGTNGTNGINGTNGTNGTNGADGLDGLTSLISATVEPSDASCSGTKYKIDTGLDNNRDGILNSGEIASTIYVCSSNVNLGKTILVLYGDVTDSEAAAIIAKDLGTNTQQVKIEDCTKLTMLNLSTLESAVDIEIEDSPELKSIDLGSLKSVAENLFLYNLPKLETLNLNSLEQAHGGGSKTGFFIENTNLSSLSFPSLKKISGSVSINSDPALTSISMPLLTKVGSLSFSEENLSTVSLPLLASGDVSIHGKLVSLSLPELVTGSVTYGNTYDPGIDDVGPLTLTSISLPKITDGDIAISHSLLTSFTLPLLKTGNLEFIENPNMTLINFPLLNYSESIQIKEETLTQLLLPELVKCFDLKINKTALTHINFPKFSANINPVYGNSSGIQILGNNDLLDINFPLLTKLGGFEVSDPNLTSFIIGTITNFSPFSYGNSVKLSGKLPSSEVNSILANLVQVSPSFTGLYIFLKQTPSSPPTGQGLIDKATLQSGGNNVDTD